MSKYIFEAYTVLDPGLFSAAVQKNKYLENWLQSRESWIWCITGASNIIGGSNNNYYVPTKVWRDLLFLGFLNAEALTTDVSSSQAPPSTSNLTLDTYEKNKPPGQKLPKQLPKTCHAKWQEKLSSVKNVLFGGNDDLAPVKVAQKLVWKKVLVPIKNGIALFDNIKKEILWELYEINFCCDLMMLDSKLAPSKWSISVDGLSDALDCVMQMSQCFVGGDTLEFTLLPPTIPTTNVRLAADKMANCRPYLIALAHFMLDWDISMDAINSIWKLINEEENNGLSDMKMYRLSHVVADVYCAGVYIILGRAAITPHCLHKPVQ